MGNDISHKIQWRRGDTISNLLGTFVYRNIGFGIYSESRNSSRRAPILLMYVFPETYCDYSILWEMIFHTKYNGVAAILSVICWERLYTEISGSAYIRSPEIRAAAPP